MTIKFKKDLTASGYDYKEGQTLESAETVFGPAQVAYLVECDFATLVGAKKETATAPTGETPEK